MGDIRRTYRGKGEKNTFEPTPQFIAAMREKIRRENGLSPSEVRDERSLLSDEKKTEPEYYWER